MTQAVLDLALQSVVFSLGRSDDLPLGLGRTFRVNGEEVAVFRQRDGRVFAVQNRCPHRGGPLADGIVGGGKVICPLHAHKFDLCDGHGSEKHECVKAYRVSVVDGEVLLHAPDA